MFILIMDSELLVFQFCMMMCFPTHEQEVKLIHAERSKHSIMHYAALASCHFIVGLQIVENFLVIFSSKVRYFHFVSTGQVLLNEELCSGRVLLKRIGDLTGDYSVRNRV